MREELDRFQRVGSESSHDEILTGELSSASLNPGLRRRRKPSSAIQVELDLDTTTQASSVDVKIATEGQQQELDLAVAAETGLQRFMYTSPRQHMVAEGNLQSTETRRLFAHRQLRLMTMIRKRWAEQSWRAKTGIALVGLTVLLYAVPLVGKYAQELATQLPRGNSSLLSTESGRKSVFQASLDLVQAPGVFAVEGYGAKVGGEYEAGARLAESMLLERWFMAVTDPEVRLAILATQIERGIREKDIASIAVPLQRMKLIPMQARDTRAALVRARAYEGLALLTSGETARGWQQRADAEVARARKLKTTIRGKGWTDVTSEQIRLGILDAQQDPWVRDGRSAQFLEGYDAAVSEAIKYFQILTSLVRIKVTRAMEPVPGNS